MKFEVNEGTGTPEKAHPGKCRKVPFLLGNWIAGFRGFKWMEINSNCFFQDWAFVFFDPGCRKFRIFLEMEVTMYYKHLYL